jgi:hypothetical protein
MKLKSKLIIIIMGILLFTRISAASQEKLSIGLELSLAVKETIASQRAELEDFIFKTKYSRVEEEERLKLIEERQARFNLALNEISLERVELKQALDSGAITQEAFTAGMKVLGLKEASSSKSMQVLDKFLVELGKEFGEKYKQKFAVLEEKQRELKKRVISQVNDTLPREAEGKETLEIEKSNVNESRRRG